MRRRLLQSEYDEIVTTMRQCRARGYDGFAEFYQRVLEDHEDRGTLPRAVFERLRMLESEDAQED